MLHRAPAIYLQLGPLTPAATRILSAWHAYSHVRFVGFENFHSRHRRTRSKRLRASPQPRKGRPVDAASRSCPSRPQVVPLALKLSLSKVVFLTRSRQACQTPGFQRWKHDIKSAAHLLLRGFISCPSHALRHILHPCCPSPLSELRLILCVFGR